MCIRDRYILMVNQLKKYFPIKGGLMSQTVGHVKAVDGVTFNLKRGHTMGLVLSLIHISSTCAMTWSLLTAPPSPLMTSS